jgi:hypothetical protein
LTLIVIIEILASPGRTFGNFTGVLLTMWAVVTLLIWRR